MIIIVLKWISICLYLFDWWRTCVVEIL